MPGNPLQLVLLRNGSHREVISLDVDLDELRRSAHRQGQEAWESLRYLLRDRISQRYILVRESQLADVARHLLDRGNNQDQPVDVHELSPEQMASLQLNYNRAREELARQSQANQQLRRDLDAAQHSSRVESDRLRRELGAARAELERLQQSARATAEELSRLRQIEEAHKQLQQEHGQLQGAHQRAKEARDELRSRLAAQPGDAALAGERAAREQAEAELRQLQAASAGLQHHLLVLLDLVVALQLGWPIPWDQVHPELIEQLRTRHAQLEAQQRQEGAAL